jgi:hypothetical protein
MSLRRDGGFVSSRSERADETISSELETNLETCGDGFRRRRSDTILAKFTKVSSRRLTRRCTVE